MRNRDEIVARRVAVTKEAKALRKELAAGADDEKIALTWALRYEQLADLQAQEQTLLWVLQNEGE